MKSLANYFILLLSTVNLLKAEDDCIYEYPKITLGVLVNQEPTLVCNNYSDKQCPQVYTMPDYSSFNYEGQCTSYLRKFINSTSVSQNEFIFVENCANDSGITYLMNGDPSDDESGSMIKFNWVCYQDDKNGMLTKLQSYFK